MKTIVATQPADRGFVARFGYFVATRYAPLKYVPYCALWVASVQFVAARSFGDDAQLSLAGYLRTAAGAFLVLLFMRVVDEWKDLDFDRVHNPDRAFSSGRVPLSDAPAYLLICATAAVLLQLGQVWQLWLSLIIMAYSVTLLYLERRFPKFADSMFANIALSVQLKTMLIAYVIIGVLRARPHGWSAAFVVIAAYLASYLHWEILRKIQWPSVAKSGDRLYSTEAGVVGSFSIVVTLQLFAAFGVSSVLAHSTFWNWILPLAALVPAAWQLHRRRERRVALGGFGLVGYLGFLLLNLATSAFG